MAWKEGRRFKSTMEPPWRPPGGRPLPQQDHLGALDTSRCQAQARQIHAAGRPFPLPVVSIPVDLMKTCRPPLIHQLGYLRTTDVNNRDAASCALLESKQESNRPAKGVGIAPQGHSRLQGDGSIGCSRGPVGSGDPPVGCEGVVQAGIDELQGGACPVGFGRPGSPVTGRSCSGLLICLWYVDL